ncbi:predicted protein [Naegleria gruberi]|uniref:Predicted protein n=1 Tax=Naegleria gruberi TaxID=5762 RepID=D2VQ80_NAEGR|nr:uncharacterized protein NAEGRDRAFT_71055 [Naegleria gruberi]EFC41062.1 predicted protein [Naegleria gruberi]|eukprot:XP_002673806.1 predicted protein [Naegleria gruberi strain NEG-M]
MLNNNNGGTVLNSGRGSDFLSVGGGLSSNGNQTPVSPLASIRFNGENNSGGDGLYSKNQQDNQYVSRVVSHKYFTIAQTSMELFSDHPAAKLGIPVLSVAQQTLKNCYSTTCRQIHTLGNDKVLLTHQCGELHYCIIYIREVEKRKKGEVFDNEDFEEEPKESTAALYRQISLLHDLTNFCIMLNPFNQHGFNNRSLNQSAIYNLMKPLVETMKRLYRTQQSVLVQGIEYVDLNQFNRGSIIEALKKGTEPYPYILHAVLLVGTKLAAVHSREKTWILLPRDILCLIVFTQSAFYGEKPKQMGKNGTSDESDNITRSIFEYLNFHVTENGGDHDQKLGRYGVYFEYDKDQDMTLMLICESNITNIQQQTTKVIPSSVGSYQSASSLTMAASFKEVEQQPIDEEQNKETVHDQLKEAAIRVNEEISNFKRFSFLKIKAESHVTMLSYLHYCPGLIHFILVDRIYNRVFAPRIVPLNTINTNQKNDEEQVAFLKKKVWEMCFTLQQYRDEGYTEIGVCGEGVQYWFKEWFEDEKMLELKMTRNNLKYARSHFELYTMYLPFVSVQAISHHNKLLVQLLLDRRDLS